MNKRIISYAMDFASFLMDELGQKEAENVRNIIFFGSAARDTATKDSDIDIFVDVAAESERMEGRVAFIADAFSRSASCRKWKLLGIKNRISCIAGRLDKWKELKPSIISDGVVLFGRYKGSAKGKSHVIFYWESVKPESKRVLLSKKLYGFSQNKTKYSGLVEKTSAIRLGSNCIIVPSEAAGPFRKVFDDIGVAPMVIYVQKIL